MGLDLPLNLRRRVSGMAPASTTPAKPKQPANAPNRWEAAYIDHLRLLLSIKEIRWFEFQPVKLNLGPKLTYMPDFMVLLADGQICMDEVKGFERDDAIAKFKMAAGKFPFIRFRMITRDGGNWRTTRDLNQQAT